jgi:hypothetical protein
MQIGSTDDSICKHSKYGFNVTPAMIRLIHYTVSVQPQSEIHQKVSVSVLFSKDFYSF